MSPAGHLAAAAVAGAGAVAYWRTIGYRLRPDVRTIRAGARRRRRLFSFGRHARPSKATRKPIRDTSR